MKAYRATMQQRVRSSTVRHTPSWLVSLVVAASMVVPLVMPYPVILQIEDGAERCFRFNIPEHDDAHMVALVLPSEDEMDNDDTLETWYVDQVFELTKKKDEHRMIPHALPDELPGNVAQKMSDYLKERGTNESPLHIHLTGTPASDPKNYHYRLPTKYFQPTVMNHVGSHTDTKAGRHRTAEDVNLEGYGICMENKDHTRQVQVIFDLVILSEEILDDDATSQNKNRFTKDKHLTPLEESLDQSINAANSVLREMNYMEKREARMRKTAESINTRVRWFSYLSVSVLLSVTYIQVSYLKRYFHKKKLM